MEPYQKPSSAVRRSTPSKENHQEKSLKAHHAELSEFMEHHLDCLLPLVKTHSKGDLELTGVQPDDIAKFFAMRVFCAENPEEDDPALVRSPTITCPKNTISFFMPMDSEWNKQTQQGNPAKL